MAKRRSMIIGMGALAAGSGAAFTSASLNNTTTTQSAAMDVYAAREISVRRGDDSDYDNDNFTINNASDLQQANVQGDTQSGDLQIETAVRNSASEKSFEYLLEIENQSTDSVSVGFGFGSFNNAFLDDGDVSTTDGDLMDMHAFEVNETDSSEGISGDDGMEISPTSTTTNASTPDNYKSIPSGETLAVDLKINPTDSIVSDINTYIDVSGNPFENSETEGVTLIDEIEVGTESA